MAKKKKPKIWAGGFRPGDRVQDTGDSSMGTVMEFGEKVDNQEESFWTSSELLGQVPVRYDKPWGGRRCWVQAPSHLKKLPSLVQLTLWEEK